MNINVTKIENGYTLSVNGMTMLGAGNGTTYYETLEEVQAAASEAIGDSFAVSKD